MKPQGANLISKVECIGTMKLRIITYKIFLQKIATQIAQLQFFFGVFPHLTSNFCKTIGDGIKTALHDREGVELDVYGPRYFGPSRCGWSRCQGLRRIPRCGTPTSNGWKRGRERSERVKVDWDLFLNSDFGEIAAFLLLLIGESMMTMGFWEAWIADKISCTRDFVVIVRRGGL